MPKQTISATLLNKQRLSADIFRLDFSWTGLEPQPGQFCMIKPKRSSVFLPRPISVALFENGVIVFIIALKGAGTIELSQMQQGDEAEISGPLGNTWLDFLPLKRECPIALAGGGLGVAPLLFLHRYAEKQGIQASFYGGFKSKSAVFYEALPQSIHIVTEDGSEGLKGLITDALQPESYAAVFACGPEAMLKALAKKCAASNTPCFVSMERRMACGVGACLGCSVETRAGTGALQNRRCCTDGPVFPAEEVFYG